MSQSTAVNPALSRILEALSVTPTLLMGLAAANFAADMVSARWDVEASLMMFSGVVVLGLADLSRRSTADARVYAALAGITAMLGGLSVLALSPSAGAAGLMMIASAGTAVHARNYGFERMFHIALLGVLIALGCQIYFAIQAFDLSGWLGLAVLGIVAIGLAAAVERHGPRMRLIAGRLLRTPARA